MLAKSVAMQRFAPDTGVYMNQADRNDPDYVDNFYRDNLASLLAAKRKVCLVIISTARLMLGARGSLSRGWISRYVRLNNTFTYISTVIIF